MSHPAEHELLAHADGELDDVAATRIARHLASCGTCAATASRQEGTGSALRAALAAIDGREPASWRSADVLPLAAHGAVVRSATPGVTVMRRAPSRELRWPAGASTSSAWRWAAGVMLVAGGAAAAVLATPLLQQREEQTATLQTMAAPAGAPAAVSVAPASGTIEVVVTGAAAGTRIVLERTASAEATVAVSGAVVPRFAALEGRIDADLAGAAAEVRVTLPETVRTATISGNGDVVIRIRDGRAEPAHATTTGVEIGAGRTPSP